MAWIQTLPDDPVVAAWWREREQRAHQEVAVAAELRAAELRAERIEQLHRRVHKLDMALAGVLSADRWEKI
jgi:4-alpha-glucanotransferase